VNPAERIAFLSATIAFTSCLLTAFFAWFTLRRETLRQQLELHKWKHEYFAGVRQWSQRLCDLLSEAIHLCDLDPNRDSEAFFKQRHTLRIQLSSMIDQGRWYFPNVSEEDHGEGKPKAYRGYRQAVLNALMGAYTAVTKLDYREQTANAARRKELAEAQRDFVSEIQHILDPARRDKEFRALTGA
jgi:hypothetical protein